MATSTADYLELRGKTYYLRMRVPAEFADVEPLLEINRSLKTRDRVDAEAKCANARVALFADWRARRAGKAADTRAIFDTSIDLLRGWGLTFSPLDDLLTGPIDDLLSRIELVASMDLNSAAVPAALGTLDLPDATLTEMAKRMPDLKAAEIRAKNPRQRREWSGNYKRAAKEFTTVIGKRTVLKISEQDATDYEDYWKQRAQSGQVTSNYANKQVRYVRQMVDAHFEDIRLAKSKRVNFFKGLGVKKLAYDTTDEDKKKLPLPEDWVCERLIGDRVLEGCNQQASDIAIVTAICGCRASEVYDLPEEDIHLDAPIPHIVLRVVLEGEDKRELKLQSTSREVVLQGPALEAMRRHPKGFTRYRGKASYSGDVNNFLRDNNLFPSLPEGTTGRYVISGLRHSFDERMDKALMTNEERAQLMGHSIGKLRGRPVYGAKLELIMRSLLQELVGIEGDGWKPRPRAEVREEINRLIEAAGYRLR